MSVQAENWIGLAMLLTPIAAWLAFGVKLFGAKRVAKVVGSGTLVFLWFIVAMQLVTQR